MIKIGLFTLQNMGQKGDEINIIKNLSNYTILWPISSYGEHYGHPENNSKLYKFAPLYKSHKGTVSRINFSEIGM